MKTSKFNFKYILLLTSLLFTFISSSEALAQEKTTSNLSEFLIQVETNETGEVRMKCTEGCAWKSLSFKLSEERKSQPVDEYGMADPQNLNTTIDPELSDFLFTIEKTPTGVNLDGLAGTAWTNLKFGLKPYQRQAINHMGMTEKDL